MTFFTKTHFVSLLFCSVILLSLFNHPDFYARTAIPFSISADSAGSTVFDKTFFRSESGYNFHPEDYSWLGVGINGGIINNPELNKFFQMELTSGRYIDENNYIQLVCGYGWIVLNKKRNLINSFEKDISVFNLGLEFITFYPSHFNDRIQYVLFGVGFSSLSMRFRYPVEIEYYEYLPDRVTVIEKLRDDGLGATDLHAGLGFNLISTPDKRFCAEVSPGFLFTAKSTREGFDNDIFKKSFYLKLKLVLYFTNNKI